MPPHDLSPTGSTATGAPPDAAMLSRARQARRLRATMSAFLPQDLLIDPAWDMMIDLFIAAAEGAALFVKDLILLSGESPATALRRIDRLQAAGLVKRAVDGRDHRRVGVTLTPRGTAAMTAMLLHLFDEPPPDGRRPRPPHGFTPADRG